MKIQVLFQGGIPKKAESPDSMQDAFCVNESFEGRSLRVALADGVSQSFMQAAWAKILTRRFCTSKDLDNVNLFEDGIFNVWVDGARNEWVEEISRTLAYKSERIRERISEKLDAGENAAATFLGLEINQNAQGHLAWRAIVIGDSCLFLVNKDKFDAYPISSSRDFSVTPDYFSSAGKTEGVPVFLQGEAEKGDVLLLATDALAKWIFQNKERGDEYFSSSRKFGELASITNWEQFYRFVNFYRSTRADEIKMEDDDTTLVSLAVDLIPQSRQIPALFRKKQEQTIEDYYSIASTSVKTDAISAEIKKEESTESVVGPTQENTRREKKMTLNRRSEAFSKVSIAISLVSFFFALLSLFVVSKLTRVFDWPAKNVAAATEIAEFMFTAGNSLYSNPDGEPIFYFATQYITSNFFVKEQWISTEFAGWIWLSNPATTVQLAERTIHTVQETRVYLEPVSEGSTLLGIAPANTAFVVLEEREDAEGNQWMKVRVRGYFQSIQE